MNLGPPTLSAFRAVEGHARDSVDDWHGVPARVVMPADDAPLAELHGGSVLADDFRPPSCRRPRPTGRDRSGARRAGVGGLLRGRRAPDRSRVRYRVGRRGGLGGRRHLRRWRRTRAFPDGVFARPVCQRCRRHRRDGRGAPADATLTSTAVNRYLTLLAETPCAVPCRQTVSVRRMRAASARSLSCWSEKGPDLGPSSRE